MRSLIGAVLLVAACADDLPPQIVSSSLVRDTQDAHGPYRIVAIVRDERRVQSASVLFTTDGTTSIMDETSPRADMRSDDGETWIAELPALPLGTVVHWIAVAEDNRGHIGAGGLFRFVVGNVPSLPEVLTLWPARGPTSGNTEVLIVGRDFRESASSRFGAETSPTTEFLSRSQVLVRTPRGPVGFVDVFVQNQDGGEGVKIQGFEYFPAPEIFEVIPDRGPTAGGTFVRILGTRFAEGARFLFGADLCLGTVIVSATEATCTTPPHAPGLVDVTIEHDTLGVGTKPNAFRYVPPPEVLAIDPDRGTDLGGTRVVVTGRNFEDGARLFFDGRIAQQISFVSPERIDAFTPPHPVGFADVIVVNPDEQRGSLDDGFYFFGPPEIDAIVPPYAAADGGATVEVVGKNFVPETIVTLEIGGVPVELECTFISDTRLSCLIPETAPASYDVTVTNPDLRSDTLQDGLTTFQILTVVPDEGPESGGNSVVITGINFPPDVDVSFGANLAACTRISETRIECIAPPGPPDTFVDVGVLPPDLGQVPSTLADGYYYVPAPVVLSVIPDFGPLRGGQTVTIVGRYFEPGATVTFDGNECTNVVYVSSTELRCTVPPGLPGLADVVVTNPDGQSGHRLAYEYVPITFTPEWGLVDGFANLEIRGAAFASNAAVTIGGQAALDVVFVSAELIYARAPSAANTGPATVVVANPGESPEVSPTPFSYRVYRDRSRPSMAGDGETTEVMVLDLDGDGENDMAFVNGSVDSPSDSQSVENRGGGTSWLARFFGSVEVANEGDHCDYDADGDEDLVWGRSDGAIRIYRNGGNFNFNSVSVPTSPGQSFEASFHQIAGDDRCDLINVAIGDPDTVLRNDNGTFVVIANAIPHEPGFIHDHKIDSADFDGDGDDDLIAVVDDINFDSETQRNRVYLNDGDGTFVEDQRNEPLMLSIHGDIYDVRVGDLDGDGDPDAVMPVFNDVPVVLLNDGSGVFARDFDRLPADAGADSSLFLEDVEGDGDLDVFLVGLTGPSALYLNDGRGFFFRALVGEPQNTPDTYRAAVGDLNGDGANDIVFGVVFGANRMDWALE